MRGKGGGSGMGYAALAAGFVLAIAGFGLILWRIWTTATIPLDNYTFAGIGLAGVGIALGGIGIDRYAVRAYRRG